MKKNIFMYLLSGLLCLLSWSGMASAASPDGATIQNLRVSIAQDKVRIVADADKEVDYKSFVLDGPQRVVIDLSDAVIGSGLKKEYTVDSDYVKKIRVAQFTPDTVRIVVETDIKKDGYDVFALPGSNPNYRVVMDFGQVTYSRTTKSTMTATNNRKVSQPVVKPTIKKIGVKPASVPKSSAAVAVPAVNFKITDEDRRVLSGKKITIDPGHGGSDSGCIGATGEMEKNVTIKVGLGLAKLLKESGAKVYLTRKGDNDVAPQPATDVQELQARVDVGNNSDSDAFVSIHLDAFTSPAAKGTSGWYYVNGGPDSRRLADDVKSCVINQLGTVDRGTKGSNFYVIKHTNMPATLVELGFLTNPEEESLFKHGDGVAKATVGIYQGLVKYFSNN